MKNFFSVLFGVIVSFQCFSQKKIDYKYLTPDSCRFYLFKIEFENGTLKTDIKGNYNLFFTYLVDRKSQKYINSFSAYPKLGEVQVLCEWDIEDEPDFIGGHSEGIIKDLDSINNTFYIQKYRRNSIKNIEGSENRYFRFLILNQKELVVLDTINNTKYYFIHRKFYPK